MGSSIINFLLLALVLLIVWYVISKFAPAIAWLVGLIFALILLVRALPLFGISLL